MRFMLQTAPTLAHASRGYSPILNFQVQDIEEVTKRAKAEYNAELDGQMSEDEFLKCIVLRTGCGLSISLHQVM